MATAPPPPQVPAAPPTLVHPFSSSDVPIRAVTVFCKNKAEVTRVMSVPIRDTRGRLEVELKDLPDSSLIDEASVRVKGSGECTILHVSYSDEPPKEPDLTQEEENAAKAREEKRKQDIERLTDELAVLNQQFTRNKCMREYADRFAERTVASTAGGSANAGAAMGVCGNRPTPSVDDVGKALDWWTAIAVQTNAEVHRLALESRRLTDAITELHKNPTSSSAAAHDRGQAQDAPSKKKKPPGRISITVDVQELGTIELEVKYMTRGATWSPSYDLRVDTQTDSVSCTYYGMVTQSTTEDWEGVSLRLSTAEPTVHGTPPTLGNKIVSLRTIPVPGTFSFSSSARGGFNFRQPAAAGLFGAPPPLPGQPAGASAFGSAFGALSACPPPPLPPTFGAVAASAPPPLPLAKPAVTQVESGGGGRGAVNFVVETPADIKSNGQMKKLTVGVLQLFAEVTHYIVPAKEPAAYLQAKATNNTDYLLLASDDVSIFFDNSFVTKTSLSSVSPGESFQTFLGIDPAVKITVAPLRKTSKKRGIFSKANHVTNTHRTSISNKKKVPVTCVVVDAMPRSTDEIIKVTLVQPPPASVSESEAINDDVLVSTALETFGGGSEGNVNDAQPQAATQAATLVAGVMKNPSNHLAWVGKIAPQSDISITLEYTMEWPTGKEIKILENAFGLLN